mmetsp:Transcript_25046/g.28786  ORF Transcript_25046/g.28786 Transcript_25046/m.28786 type:complete len:115 (-) Transcript_25046:282-626(-)
MQLGKLKEAQSCLEHAAKACRENWKIWENLILLYLQSENFMRVVSSIRRLIAMKKTDRINVHLMIKVANCFINKFIKSAVESEESITRNTKTLFDLFDKVLDVHPKDPAILKLY